MAKVKFEISARDKSKATLNRFKNRIEGVKSGIFSFKGAVVSMVGAAGLGAFVTQSLKSADVLAKTSDKLGLTTKALAGMRYAAELSGVATTTLDMGIQRMTRRLSEAAIGTGEAQGALKELGLDARKLAAMSPDQAFQKIAGAMSQVTNQSDRVRLSFKLFDSEGVALVNTLAMGEAGLRAAAEEADALGLSLSGIDKASIEEANNSFTRMKALMGGLGNAISASVSPYITAFTDNIINAAKEAGGMANFVNKAMKNVVNAVGFAADMVRGLQVVWKGLKFIALGALSAIITGLDDLNKAGAAALNWIPGIDIKPSGALSAWAEESRASVAAVGAEFIALANAPMPSGGVKAYVEDLNYKAQAAAAELAKINAAKNAAGGGAGGAGATSTAGEDAAAAKQAAALSKSIDQVQQSLLTEEQRISESYDRRSFMVEDAFQNQLISEQYKNELLQGLEQQNQDKLLAIVAAAEQKKRAMFSAGLGAAANIFTNLSALMGKEGAKMNAKQKLLARAGIIASTAQAVMNALAVPPYPLGLSLAVGAGLQGAQQLRKVGGGGGISAPVASPIAQAGQSQPIPPQQLQGQQQSVVVNINGTVLANDIETIIADAVRSGVNSENIIIEVNGERAVVN